MFSDIQKTWANFCLSCHTSPVRQSETGALEHHEGDCSDSVFHKTESQTQQPYVMRFPVQRKSNMRLRFQMKFMEIYPTVALNFREARTVPLYADPGIRKTVRNQQWYCYSSVWETISVLLLHIM